VTRPSRQASQERTRQPLLHEERRLFREKGFAAPVLKQIAEAAEVTEGAIYGHFSNKEDLLLTAVERTRTSPQC
jgi:AcrR family transcriptional regulator